MSRPANTDALETRRRVLDAAVRMFAQHGFHGASTREIAKKARINIGTLNYHFDSKQGLYHAAVDEVYRRLRERATGLVLENDPTQLESLLERLYLAGRAERDGVRLLVREVLDHGRLSGRTETAHYLPEMETITHLSAALLGCTVERARTAAVAVTYLVSRYVIQDEASLLTAFGVKSKKQAQARVVASLGTAARALVGKA